MKTKKKHKTAFRRWICELLVEDAGKNAFAKKLTKAGFHFHTCTLYFLKDFPLVTSQWCQLKSKIQAGQG